MNIKFTNWDKSVFLFFRRTWLQDYRVFSFFVFRDQFFQKGLLTCLSILIYQLKHVKSTTQRRHHWHKHLLLVYIPRRVRNLWLLFFKVKEFKVGISECSVKVSKTLNVVQQQTNWNLKTPLDLYFADSFRRLKLYLVDDSLDGVFGVGYKNVFNLVNRHDQLSLRYMAWVHIALSYAWARLQVLFRKWTLVKVWALTCCKCFKSFENSTWASRAYVEVLSCEIKSPSWLSLLAKLFYSVRVVFLFKYSANKLRQVLPHNVIGTYVHVVWLVALVSLHFKPDRLCTCVYLYFFFKFKLGAEVPWFLAFFTFSFLCLILILTESHLGK